MDSLPSFEVLQVANGFMIRPPYNIARGEFYTASDVRVFPTWSEASKWLGDQFRAKAE